jgi:RHS repeat-associated protein
VNGTENKYKTYNGKELEEELGKNTLAYGWRDYDPAIGRFNKVDRFAEKYYSLSTYSYAGNNPILFVDVQGDSIASGASTRKANRIERRAERRADRVDRRADKREARGQDVADLRERSSELRQSGQDIRDMRADKNNMFRFASVNSREAKNLELGGPATTQTGTTESGLNEITLFTEGNMGSQLHETRHAGQTARGELGSNYGVADEVSAYRAQYSWNGKLNYTPFTDFNNQANLTRLMTQGMSGFKRSITNINQITPTIVNSMVDKPGLNQIFIYPPKDASGNLLIPLNIWNSN